MKVKITCTQRVHYSQTVEMTKSEYKRLSKTSDQILEGEHTSPLSDLLDLRDVYGGGDFEDVEIEPV